MIDAFEVRGRPRMRDVRRPANEIRDGRVELTEAFPRHAADHRRHAVHDCRREPCRAAARLEKIAEDTAVPDDRRCHSRILRDVQRLHASARLTHDRDLGAVELLVEGAALPRVFRDRPVHTVDQLRCVGHPGRRLATHHRRVGGETDGDDQKSVRGDLGEEVAKFTRRISTAAVRPGHDRQAAIRTERRQIPRPVERVRGEAIVTREHGLERPGSAVANRDRHPLGERTARVHGDEHDPNDYLLEANAVAHVVILSRPIRERQRCSRRPRPVSRGVALDSAFMLERSP